MNTQTFFEYINKFIHLTDTEKEIVLSKITFRNYLKGQFIDQQGDISKNSSFVISGATKMFFLEEDGQEHIILFSIKNWWTGDLGSYISQKPADYYVQCLENTTVIQFSYEKREELFTEIPKMERFFRIILEKALTASQKRIIRNFSLSAKERYLIFKKSYPTIEQQVPQYLIASYLGITKEFLSKIKSQLIFEQ